MIQANVNAKGAQAAVAEGDNFSFQFDATCSCFLNSNLTIVVIILEIMMRSRVLRRSIWKTRTPPCFVMGLQFLRFRWTKYIDVKRDEIENQRKTQVSSSPGGTMNFTKDLQQQNSVSQKHHAYVETQAPRKARQIARNKESTWRRGLQRLNSKYSQWILK